MRVKLIRDRMVCTQGGRTQSVNSLAGRQLALVAKLHEEAEEIATGATDASEYADLLEVMIELAHINRVPWSEIERVALEKRAERGGSPVLALVPAHIGRVLLDILWFLLAEVHIQQRPADRRGTTGPVLSVLDNTGDCYLGVLQGRKTDEQAVSNTPVVGLGGSGLTRDRHTRNVAHPCRSIPARHGFSHCRLHQVELLFRGIHPPHELGFGSRLPLSTGLADLAKKKRPIYLTTRGYA